MAKAKLSGPILSQRERKSKSLIKEEENPNDNDNGEILQTNNTLKTSIPQEELIRFLGRFAIEHLSSSRIIQLGCLSFIILQAYVKFNEIEKPTDQELNLLISASCGLIAFLSAIYISFKVKSNSNIKYGLKAPVTLPPWNSIYLIFIPSILAYALDKNLLLYNIAFASTVLELPYIGQILTQTALISSNSETNDVLFNVKASTIHLAINFFLRQITQLKSLDRVEVNLFSILLSDLYLIKSQSLYVIILQKLFIAFGVGCGVTFTFTILIPQNNIYRTLLILITWATSFIYTTLYQLNDILGENSIKWIVEFATVTPTRQNILIVWFGSLLLLIPTIFNYKVKLSPNFRRKIWHFLILGLIVYPLHIDPEFVKVALSGSLILFLLVEQLRFLRLAPFGDFLDSNLRIFADFRDERGPIIFSYIYLFIGISIPILFENSVVGLVALGVGDSLASIVGSNFGLLYWSGSKKTIEGTLTFIVTSYGVCALLKILGWFFNDKSFHSLLLTCVLSGILEGNSDLNDNILIPAYMEALLFFLD
ncbi:hypothetical protein WICMUC_003172 [Wickerhamomyces mucosus]|uniref:dolichol kinase n=1 Tax=Wickerhamomyces mucosus TaxID=1378264 RepID=A0A9P8TD09_9ASCO|nr:hypothetical protein WICMUC_003172 [Wickerhamomyces mucosus]